MNDEHDYKFDVGQSVISWDDWDIAHDLGPGEVVVRWQEHKTIYYQVHWKHYWSVYSESELEKW